MTTTLAEPAAPAPVPVAAAAGRPSLLRAEARRLMSRRFIRVLLLLAALGYVAALALASTQYTKTTPEVLADAQRQLEAAVVSNEQFRQQCLADPSLPSDMAPEEYCGPELTAEEYGSAENFIDAAPFSLAAEGLDGAMVVAFAVAALAFVIGATFIGAEWSSRSLVALLFWEPRRLRVMGAKLAVLAGGAAVLAALAQLAWLGGARLLAAARGTSDVPPGYWTDLLQLAGRGVGVAVIAALLGFGFANAVRNSAAALGVGFLYFAIAENVVRAFRPGWQQWLVTDNAVAFVQSEPYTIYRYTEVVDERGFIQMLQTEYVLTHLQAGILLSAVTLAVVAIGLALFARRDLN